MKLSLCIPMTLMFWSWSGHVLLVAAFTTLPSESRRQAYYPLASTSSEEVDRLRESASKLRKEAEALQDTLNVSSLRKRPDSTSGTTPAPPLAYKDLKDSSWAFTYRFSKEPETEDSKTNSPINYSGKLTVTFRSDRYTSLISHEPSGSPRLEISKVWGWDEEVSNEDEERYVLFSVDTQSGDSQERYYWQARIDVNEKGEITLTDGTVTVKKDVEPPGGFWGVFNGGGILAQFRYVGNFGGRPVQSPVS